MAITRIDLPALWTARIETGVQSDIWTVGNVINPADPNTQHIAYYATSYKFGSLVGFNHKLLSDALRSDLNATVSVKMRGLDENDPYSYVNVGVHTLQSPPNQGESITFKYLHNETVQGNDIVDGWNERDISTFRIELSNDATGIALLPGNAFDVYEPSLILRGNWIPNRPTLETPTGGVLRDRTKPIEFKWVHSGIYPQNKYELRYRVKGTSTWTTINATSTSQSHTLSANTLSANEYEWQVRTTMSDGINEAVSPWSSIAVFNATNETNAPTIQSPTNGQTLPTQNLTVQWASVPNQTQINVELIRNGQRVQQITRSQTGNSITLNGWLDNNQSYIVRLRVLASGQLWSDWAEVNINVSYTQPARPTLNIIPDQDNANLLIRINNPAPTGTQPTPVRQDLFKREPGGNWIKLANLLPNSDYVDYAVASGQQYEYRVTVYADNDTSITSNVFRNSVEIDQTVINVANEPNIFVKFDHVRERSALSELSAIRKQFAGRRFPVTEFGEIIENNIEIESLIESRADYDYLVNMINRQETLIYRDARGRKMYATVSGLTVVDESLGRYSVSLAFNQVDYKEGID